MKFVTPTGRPQTVSLVAGTLFLATLLLTFPVLKADFSRLEAFVFMTQGFLQEPAWDYLPTLIKLCGETLGMAFVATLIAVTFATPLALLAARNTTPTTALGSLTKTVFSLIRAVPDMIWAAMLAGAVGIGVLPGVLALIISSTAFLVKVFSESLEVVDPKPIEGVLAHGASPLAVRTVAIVPQAAPDMLGLSLYMFDVNVRCATILGLVGAGGIGYDLTTATKLQYWDRLFLIILAIFLMVTLIDRLSTYLRGRLVN